jgi:hypothetical protein
VREDKRDKGEKEREGGREKRSRKKRGRER